MAEHTTIEWTDATWNPITGCTVVSPGCTNCYAMKLAGTRMAHHHSREGLTIDTKAGPVWNGQVRFNERWLTLPLRWKRPRRVFVCAHGDLFHESVPDEWIDKVFAVMALAPQHTFQCLTKRSKRMREYSTDDDRIARQCGAVDEMFPRRNDLSRAARDAIAYQGPLPNVWLGVSAEDQTRADERIPDLLATPAAIRFVSYEPALGPIDFTDMCNGHYFIDTLRGTRFHDDPDHINTHHKFASALDWLICGGESGPAARPMHPDWARSARDQCQAAGVPFFFKQWGNWLPGEANIGQFAARPMNAYRRVDNHSFEWPNGDRQNFGTHPDRFSGPLTTMNVGKKAAGRLLDGVEWNQTPSQRETHL